jgi:hypothetical protein
VTLGLGRVLRRARFDLRRAPRVPSPRLIQELVQAWKALKAIKYPAVGANCSETFRG